MPLLCRVHRLFASHEQIEVPIVLFIGSKVEAMQRLIPKVPEGQETS
jgi:hypothetical protein